MSRSSEINIICGRSRSGEVNVRTIKGQGLEKPISQGWSRSDKINSWEGQGLGSQCHEEG